MKPVPLPHPGPARRPRRTRLILAGVAALAMVGASVATALTAGAAVPPPAAGWSTVFSDDFTGAANTGVNTANWLYDLGHGYPGGAANWGTGEVETMTNSTQNVFQDGAGHLVIKPIRDGAGNWTSGRIETQRTDFAAPAGGKLRIEASIQQPNVSGAAALGYWPAFWALAAAARPVGATNWPGVGEWDIMEDINGLSSEFGTLHCGVRPGGPCNETTGIGSGQRACGGCQTGYHTYAVEYDRSVSPEQLRWYLDGNNYFTVNANQVDATTWNNAVHHGFFIILNVAIGGRLPGCVRRRTHRLDPVRRTDERRLCRGVLGRGRYPDLAAAEPDADRGRGRRYRRVRDDPGGVRQRPGRYPDGDHQRCRWRPGCRLDRQRGLVAIQQSGLWYDPGDTVHRTGRLRSGRGSQRSRRGTAGLPEQHADRQLRDREYRRLAELANRTGEHRHDDRYPHGVSHVHQRPAGRLRERQLGQLRSLTRS